jgi:ribonuclease E
LFRKRRAEVVRRGVGDTAVEERETTKVAGSTVEIRRVREVEQPRNKNGGQKTKDRKRRDRGERRPSRQRPTTRTREYIAPPPTDRKQMLVRRTEHQTQIVVLEGALLVEHYVARSDRQSLAGNIYVGKVRNVLPGMEAAFIDFGEAKNGVLYAGDVASSTPGRRKQRIEQVLKTGDEILVQVVKDAMGHKGARLTNEINLSADAERDSLKQIGQELRPDGFGIIIRTAAGGASKEDIGADIERLLRTWLNIQRSTDDGGAPRLVYEEPPLTIRVIREHFTRDFRRLLVDEDEIHDLVVSYLSDTDADLVERVQRYEDELPLFERFHVEDQLRKALDRKVWLPSGGHIVVDRTEALTVVDVNTGRFVGHSNLEETVLKNNLEAAEEIAHQLRLRDIGGIIVIDFIDMEIAKNRDDTQERVGGFARNVLARVP